MKTLILERAFADTLIAYDGRAILLPGHADGWPTVLRDLLAGTVPERLAVGLGPGSFAGIRGAIACLQGLGLGWRLPVCGYPSAAHLALCSGREEVNVIGDARRNTLWSVRYRVTPDAILQDGDFRLLARERFLPAADMVSPDAERLAAYGFTPVRPDATRLEETVAKLGGLLKPDPIPLYLHPAVGAAHAE